MKTRRLESRVLASLLLTYTIVIFLPFCAWVLSLAQYSRTITSQAHELNRGKVKTLGEAVDARLDNVQPSSLGIVADISVRKLIRNQTSAVDPVEQFNVIQNTMDMLARAVSRDSNVDSMFIYFKDADYVLSDTTKVSDDLYYNIVSLTSRIDRDTWLSYLKDTHSLQYHFVPGKSTKGNIFCFMPISSLGSGDRATATLVVKMRPNMFSDLLADLGMNSSMVSVYSAQGELMYSNYDMSDGEEGSLSQFVSSTVVSTNSGWKFVSYVSTTVFNEQIDGLWRYTLILAACVVVLCLITTVYGMRRNYNPLADLVTMLENALKRRRDSNEYEYLRDSIDSLIDTTHESSRLLAQQTQQLRNDCIERLLLGASRLGEHLPEHLSRLGMEFASDQYAVIAMDYSPDRAQDGESGKKRPERFAMRDQFYGHSVEIDGRTVFLIDATQLTSHTLRERAYGLYGILRELSPDLIMAVSRIHQGETGISNGYNEAISVLEYTMVLSREPFLCYDDILYDSISRYYFPPEDEREFLNAVSSGDEKQALALARNVWAANQRAGSSHPALKKLLHHSFISALMKVVCEPASGITEECLLNEIAFAGSGRITTSQLKESCERAITSVCAGVKKACENSGDDLFERIMEYIRTNYHESDLDIGKICVEFSCSRTRLFYLFKERCLSGVLNVINTTRVDAAKRLIASGKNISDVAVDVGYLNTGSFLRVFKRYEGMTPTQYRESLARQ